MILMILTIDEVIPALEELDLEGKLQFIKDYQYSFAFDVITLPGEIHLETENIDYVISLNSV